MMLQKMLEIHAPKVWVFGHYHKDWQSNIEGTKFVCLNELCTLNFKDKENYKEWIGIL